MSASPPGRRKSPAGERDALVARHQEDRWSYRTLKERVDAFGRGEPGQHWPPNNPQGVVTQFATARIGRILNINPGYQMAALE